MEYFNKYFGKVTIGGDIINNKSLFTNNLIKIDEIILSIPHDNLILYENIKYNKLYFKILNNKNIYYPKYVILALEIYLNKNKYQDHINSFPKNFPLNLIEKYKNFKIENHNISNEVIYIIKKLQEYSNDINFIIENYNVDYKEYLYFYYMTISRIFGITYAYEKCSCLCLCADLINHNSLNNVYWDFDEVNKNFNIYALENINSETEIFLNYGNKSNSLFLINYGFIPDNNTDNYITLFFNNRNIELYNPDNIKFISFLLGLKNEILEEEIDSIKELIDKINISLNIFKNPNYNYLKDFENIIKEEQNILYLCKLELENLLSLIDEGINLYKGIKYKSYFKKLNNY